MRFFIALFFSVWLNISFSQAIKLYPSSWPKILTATGDTLKTPFPGGMISPIFSNIDLNGDGAKDLFVFDKADGRIMTFLTNGNTSKDFIYAPQYEHIFPKMYGWAFLVDYNNDGKQDIFTFAGDANVSNTGCTIYKNIGTGKENKFKVVTYAMKYRNNYTTDEIFLSSIEMPAFADVDQDGDIDIISFKTGEGGRLWYYKNKALENHSNLDSFEYVLKSQCWGKVLESSAAHDMTLADTACNNNLSLPNEKRGHAGSALLSYDNDGDGDNELVVGDIGYNTVFFLTNGRISSGKPNWKNDTIVAKDTVFPTTKYIKLPAMPLAAYVDVNNDGKRDMLASSMEQGTIERNISWLYENTGTDKSPSFKFKKENFLEELMIDEGEQSAPCFIDYNNDSLPDMVLGAYGGTNPGQYSAYLELYKNVGTKKKAVFKLVDNNFLGLRDQGLNDFAPAAADVNEDGKVDLILGSGNGKLRWYKNSGSGSTTSFSEAGELAFLNGNNIPESIDAGNDSKPSFADINVDGKPDMLLGNTDTSLFYYQGEGLTNGKPIFKQIKVNYGNIKLSKRMSPCLSDFNNNGKIDLVLGSDKGSLKLYTDIDKNGNYSAVQDFVFDFGSNSLLNPFIGNNTMPSAAKLDGDSLPDLMVGTVRGGLCFFGSVNNGTDTSHFSSLNERTIQNSNIKIYPNPTTGELNISFINNQNKVSIIIISDILGRDVYSIKPNAADALNTMHIDLSNLKAGLYNIRIINNEELLYDSKVIISR